MQFFRISEEKLEINTELSMRLRPEPNESDGEKMTKYDYVTIELELAQTEHIIYCFQLIFCILPFISSR